MGILSTITLFLFLAAACATDLRSQRIPNRLIGAMAGSWLFLQALSLALGYATLLSVGLSIAAALVLGGVLFAFTVIFEHLTRAFAMGGGDIKLIACIALFVGIERGCVALAIACVLAVLANVLQRSILVQHQRIKAQAAGSGLQVTKEGTLPRSFPFAPALACGTVASLLF